MTIHHTLKHLARRSPTLSVALAVASLFATIVASAATCPPGLGAANPTPTSDFLIDSNGTVTHTATSLMWKQCNEGLTGSGCGTGSALYLAWPDALSAAKNSTFAGYSDWRVPNKQELESLIDNRCYVPAINDTVFPSTVSGQTWTSTTAAGGGNGAFYVNFNVGLASIDFKDTQSVVRLVRGGQSFDALGVAPPTLNLDDSDAATRYGAATDGLLLLRYLFGVRGAALTAGALGDNPLRSAAQIEAYIAVNLAAFDVDGDTKILATTDGLMILRRLLGLSGTALTAGAKNSLRSDVDVAAAIDVLKP